VLLYMVSVRKIALIVVPPICYISVLSVSNSD